MASTKTIAVLDAAQLKDGELKEVDFGEGKVLLSKLGGEVHATSAFCTHYGAPLSKGVLVSSGRVTCPWHGACFNVRSGDIEDSPALAAIHSFQTEVKDGKIYVTADTSKVTKEAKSRPPTNRAAAKAKASSAPSDASGVVIVGGGAGAIAAVIALRETGYAGRVTVLSAEPHAPIDRTKLSKALPTDTGSLEWYSTDTLKSQYDVDFRSGVTVSSVDVQGKSVTVEGGQKVSWEKLILAPGSIPRRLPIPGADLPNVFVLRGVEDAKKIDASLGEGKNLVIVGSSFIGMELAAAVGKKGLKSIHVIGMTEFPFEAVLGAKVGAGLRKYHESQGVTFHGNAKSTSINSTPSGAAISGPATSVSVEYDSGEKVTLDADLVVLAVGVSPATEFLEGSAIPRRKEDGGVVVDEYLRVKGAEGVYAIGDIAVFPEPTSGELRRIEHWNVAQNHGRAVAHGIATGKLEAFDKTPIFWSAQGQQLRYIGNAVDYDDVYITGDPAELKFVAYYFKGDKVLAVSSMQADPLASKCSELMRLGVMPSASEIKGGKDPLTIDIASSGSAAGMRR